ncbi:macrolide ABC transporter ATP-binding protein [filamentous cyanobacterium CCP3]|nr:macrolide ABC transporter ATP-binding protein [filamentous cyanobacterium CCP3]
MNGSSGPQPAAIAMENLSRVFGAGEAAVRACDRINLTIQPGEYCAIMGQSGSGKSTLMNIISCLDRPTSGRYWLDGTDVSTVGKTRLTRLRNRKLGFVFQRYELLPNLTALENVILPMMYAGVGRGSRRRRAEAALTHMGLANRMDKRPPQLSGGQQQRVAIARAIVNQPVLLLADEPTGALDYSTGKLVLEALANVNRELGSTTAVITHNAGIAAMADRVVTMRSGEIIRIDRNEKKVTPSELEW